MESLSLRATRGKLHLSVEADIEARVQYTPQRVSSAPGHNQHPGPKKKSSRIASELWTDRRREDAQAPSQERELNQILRIVMDEVGRSLGGLPSISGLANQPVATGFRE